MSSARCGACGAPMGDADQLCAACGSKAQPQFDADSVEGETGVFYCFRHKREKTRLRCGRCARAICTSCAVIGPAGSRCPVCAKNKVPVSARGLAHDTTRSLRSIIGGPYRFMWILILLSVATGIFRNCSLNNGPREPIFIEEQEPPPE